MKLILIEKITVDLDNGNDCSFELWGDHLDSYQTRVTSGKEIITAEFETLSGALSDLYKDALYFIKENADGVDINWRSDGQS